MSITKVITDRLFFRTYLNHFRNDYTFLSFYDYLSAVQKPPASFIKSMERIRTIDRTNDEGEQRYQKEKLLLPCIQPAYGCMVNTRNKIVEIYNSIYPIDVEGPGALQKLLDKAGEHVLCYHHSTNGEDYVAFVIGVPVFSQEEYSHYAKMVQDFLQIESNEGQSYCNKKRALVYDANLVVNENAKPLFLTETLTVKKTALPVKRNDRYELGKVKAKINYLLRNGIDITENYHDWVKIGFAFLSAFDEATAKVYFLKVSSLHPNFNEKECATKFDELASSFNKDDEGITIKTFYYLVNNSKANAYVK